MSNEQHWGLSYKACCRSYKKQHPTKYTLKRYKQQSCHGPNYIMWLIAFGLSSFAFSTKMLTVTCKSVIIPLSHPLSRPSDNLICCKNHLSVDAIRVAQRVFNSVDNLLRFENKSCSNHLSFPHEITFSKRSQSGFHVSSLVNNPSKFRSNFLHDEVMPVT